MVVPGISWPLRRENGFSRTDYLGNGLLFTECAIDRIPCVSWIILIGCLERGSLPECFYEPRGNRKGAGAGVSGYG
jgi:hypothetical protein